MTETSNDPSRSSGAAFAAKIDQEKTGRAKSRSLRPLFALWPFISRYPGHLTAFLIFLVLSALGSLAMPWILKLIIDCGFGEGNTTISICASIATDSGNSLNRYFIFAGLFAVIFAITGSLRFFFITRLGQRVIADIRKAVFDQLTKLSPAYFERVRTGEVLSRLTTDTPTESPRGSPASLTSGKTKLTPRSTSFFNMTSGIGRSASSPLGRNHL